MVTEMWERTILEDDILSPSIANKLRKKMIALGKLGYIHNDVHPGNIVVRTKNDQIIDVALIDFEGTITIEEAQENLIPYFLPKESAEYYANNPTEFDLDILDNVILQHSSTNTLLMELRKAIIDNNDGKVWSILDIDRFDFKDKEIENINLATGAALKVLISHPRIKTPKKPNLELLSVILSKLK